MIDSINRADSFNFFPPYSSLNTAVGADASKTGSIAAQTGRTASVAAKEVKPVAKKDADSKVENNKKQPDQTVVRFKLHKETGTTMIQIVDSSGKVIKEIPPEKILDSIAQIWKNAGIKIDKSV